MRATRPYFKRNAEMVSCTRRECSFLVVEERLVIYRVRSERPWRLVPFCARNRNRRDAGGIEPSTHEDGHWATRQTVEDGLLEQRTKLFHALLFASEPQGFFDGQRGETPHREV